MTLNESIVEDAVLQWIGEMGYAVDLGCDSRPAIWRRSGQLNAVGTCLQSYD